MKKIIFVLVIFFIFSQNLYSQTSEYKYDGQLKKGISHGQGTFTWPDGEKCVGEFKDDKMHGQETYTYANGDKYVGEYKDNN